MQHQSEVKKLPARELILERFSYDPLTGWQASIRYKRVSHYIGRFVSEHEAAAAYDEHAVRLFGEFARPNFPLRLQGSSP